MSIFGWNTVGPLYVNCMIIVFAHPCFRSANAGDNTSTRTTPNSRTGVQPSYTNLTGMSFLSRIQSGLYEFSVVLDLYGILLAYLALLWTVFKEYIVVKG
ncbi:hypothetical protein OG21DRAFT_1503177 [Imleria badia]|nr:hypothetical protein OG21DRAFT_1503177 [Imleria badia]